jgi:alanine dehydrogenase
MGFRFPGNRSLGLPYISGLIILNDAATGVPTGIMDAVEITAARTAAASGVCIRRWAPAGWKRIAIIGCGEQGHYHAAVANALEPAAVIAAYDPEVERSRSLPGDVDVCDTVTEAVDRADVIVTAAPITTTPTPTVTRDLLRDDHLVLPIDFDATIDASVVAGAELFMTDDLGQFDYYRDHGHFGTWPRADESVGDALGRGAPARSVVCCNQGVGALDIAFASRVVRDADASHDGTQLPH